jgi:hypothetical protein
VDKDLEDLQAQLDARFQKLKLATPAPAPAPAPSDVIEGLEDVGGMGTRPVRLGCFVLLCFCALVLLALTNIY